MIAVCIIWNCRSRGRNDTCYGHASWPAVTMIYAIVMLATRLYVYATCVIRVLTC